MNKIYKTKIKNLFFFNLEDFIFYKYIWKMYILAGLKIKIEKNKIYIGTKTTFEFFWVQTSLNF